MTKILFELEFTKTLPFQAPQIAKTAKISVVESDHNKLFFISEGGNWGSTASDNQVCNHLRNMKIHKSMAPSESSGRTGSHSGLETLHI